MGEMCAGAECEKRFHGRAIHFVECEFARPTRLDQIICFDVKIDRLRNTVKSFFDTGNREARCVADHPSRDSRIPLALFEGR